MQFYQCYFCNPFLTHGVMVALQILVLSVKVRILMGQLNIEQGTKNNEWRSRLKYFNVRCSLFLVHYSKLPCSIMVVRQILALNVRVQILAGQQRIATREQGTMKEEVD